MKLRYAMLFVVCIHCAQHDGGNNQRPGAPYMIFQTPQCAVCMTPVESRHFQIIGLAQELIKALDSVRSALNRGSQMDVPSDLVQMFNFDFLECLREYMEDSWPYIRASMTHPDVVQAMSGQAAIDATQRFDNTLRSAHFIGPDIHNSYIARKAYYMHFNQIVNIFQSLNVEDDIIAEINSFAAWNFCMAAVAPLAGVTLQGRVDSLLTDIGYLQRAVEALRRCRVISVQAAG